MLFSFYCTDDPVNGLETRKSVRREHLAYLKELGDKMVLAGPFLSEDGATPIGSLIVVEVENEAEAKSIAENDPYNKAGVFSSVDIRRWNWLFGKPSK